MFLLDLLIPRKTLRVRKKDCPWLSSVSLVKIRHLRDIAHCKALKSGSSLDWLSYRSLKNKATSMLWSAKAAYFSNSLRSKPTKSWQHFQCLSKHPKGACDIQLSATANELNCHFISIPHKTVAGLTSSVPATEYVEKFLEDKTVPTVKFVHVNNETVSSIIASLDTNKATGADGLPARFLRTSPHMVRLITF